MKTLNIKSFAKINICLNVKKSKIEGIYHDVDMVMLPITLHDSMLITEVKGVPDSYITIDDYSRGVIDSNIVTGAIELFAKEHNVQNKFNIFIHKNIPMQAGLGGGSSNAAFALKGINKYLKLNLSHDQLFKMAEKLGSDVPFFLNCVPARCQGRGNILTPITVKNDYYCLIVKPDFGCSTHGIYDLSDTMELETGDVDAVIKALTEGDDELLEKSIFNSLEKPAFSIHPEIKEIIDMLKKMGLKIVMMSGSGSAVFALGHDKKLMLSIEKKISDHFFVDICKVTK